MKTVEKPRLRSKLRQRLGKEYYILKRKVRWYFGRHWYVRRPGRDAAHPVTTHRWVAHRSMLL